MPILRLTKGDFDHKFVGSLCILGYPVQLEQINCDCSWTHISFWMASTPGQHLFASQNVLGTPGNKFSVFVGDYSKTEFAVLDKLLGHLSCIGADLIE